MVRAVDPVRAVSLLCISDCYALRAILSVSTARWPELGDVYDAGTLIRWFCK